MSQKKPINSADTHLLLAEGGMDRFKIGDSFRDDNQVLWHIKQCGNCGVRFFSRTSKSKFCADKCRIKSFRQLQKERKK